MRVCQVEGCESKHLAKGMCRLHWRRSRYATEGRNPTTVLFAMVSLRGAHLPTVKPVKARVTVGVMVDCPACPDIMAASDPVRRVCRSCGTTALLNEEEVSWLTSERRSTRALQRTGS